MEKAVLNHQLETLLQNNEDVLPLAEQVEHIHIQFSELMEASRKEQLQSFLNEGGDELEFNYSPDAEDLRYNDLHTTFKQRHDKQVSTIQEAKENVLTTKKQIIDELKAITKTDKKSLRSSYDKAKKLQERWEQSGPNNNDELLQLESEYKYNIELFYHNAKITREFILLDFQKNLEAKNVILEKVKALEAEENGRIIEQKLKQYQKEWFRVGPVMREIREENRKGFDEVVATIEAKLDVFYAGQEELLRENLKKKIDLCEQVNSIRENLKESPKDYQRAANEVLKIQKEWKIIGRSEENDRVWDVFRQACDAFFERKRQFFNQLSVIRKDNKKAKLGIVEQAETLQAQTDWKKTTEALISLQKEWKSIGPAQPSDDQKLWKRFRAACDFFFKAKSEYYNGLDDQQEDNLIKKQSLIKELQAYQPNGNAQEAVQILQNFEKEWQAIGHVPFSEKDSLYQAYFETLNSKYDLLKMDRVSKTRERFKNKVVALTNGDNSNKQLKQERFKLRQQIERAEKKLAQYQNNIHFFSGQNANPLLKDIEKNIRQTEQHLDQLKDKLQMIYDLEDEVG
ncbi:MAG: DUF349 domain-containing protein [Saprospiraceae bacterium]|nr:DUF349 domain-containing protein [Saprospiraceae bacterium]